MANSGPAPLPSSPAVQPEWARRRELIRVAAFRALLPPRGAQVLRG